MQGRRKSRSAGAEESGVQIKYNAAEDECRSRSGVRKGRKISKKGE